MMRRTMLVCAALAAVGCATREPRVGAQRTTLMPDAEGNIDFDFSTDGRVVFTKVVVGKAAVFVAKGDWSEPRRVSFGVWDANALWSPDGKWIAFRRDAGQQDDVLIVPSDSGAELVVSSTSADENLRGWLDGGRAVLFLRSEDRGFQPWVYRLADRATVRLFEADGSIEACTAPDGTSVAYTLSKNGSSTLWLFDLETQAHRQLTTEGFEAVKPQCFSPDGKSVLFESRRTGTTDLWSADVATGSLSQLTADVADDAFGKWSPDGARIVFASKRGGQPDLWVLATGDGDAQRVTDDAFEEFSANWTPDGRAIIARVALGHQHLFRFPVAGGAPVPLTSGDWEIGSLTAINAGDRLAELSADRSRVAYSGNKNGDADIWVVPSAGGESRLVSGAPGFDGEPTWSPDGARIAFTSVRSGNLDIWVAAADGGAAAVPQRLTDWPSGELSASWSPDGRTIAFLSTRESAGVDLWTVPATGGTPQRITTYGSVVSAAVRWSPDSRIIVFAAQVAAEGGEVLLSVPARGGAARRIAPATSRAANWSPDGRELALYRCTEGYCSVEIRSPAGDLLRTLSTGKEVFEIGLQWPHDGAEVLVTSQDLNGLAFNRMDIRPATGSGLGRILESPAGTQVSPVGFGPGDSTVIAIVGVGATTLQRIAAPAPLKAP